MIVNPTELIETLKDLKETRRLSSESEAIMNLLLGYKLNSLSLLLNPVPLSGVDWGRNSRVG